MPSTPHVEKHFTASESVRDVVIGMADGLTVPFALAAGLSAAVSIRRVIVTAGLAEIAAGAIAMGLGGYLAARGDATHYAAEEARERYEIEHLRDREVSRSARNLRRLRPFRRHARQGRRRRDIGQGPVDGVHDAFRTGARKAGPETARRSAPRRSPSPISSAASCRCCPICSRPRSTRRSAGPSSRRGSRCSSSAP